MHMRQACDVQFSWGILNNHRDHRGHRENIGGSPGKCSSLCSLCPLWLVIQSFSPFGSLLSLIFVCDLGFVI